MQTIIINWERQNSKHEVNLFDNDIGLCVTHGHLVTKEIRCNNFPCQSAMWSDLWEMEIKKIGACHDAK